MFRESAPYAWVNELREIPGVDVDKRRVPCNTFELLDLAESPLPKPKPPPWEDEAVLARLQPWVMDFITTYQKEAWEWSAYRDGSALWWACGAGKTLASLLWLASGPEDERCIVVTRAPAKSQWHRETTHYTKLRPTILNGQNPGEMNPSCRLVVLSWEILPHWVDTLIAWTRGHPAALVFDEAHKGKAWKRRERYVNPLGKVATRWMDNRAAACARLSTSVRRTLGLTATPIRDRRSDLWAQLDLMQPREWGSNWEWVHRYCDAVEGQYGGIDTSGISNTEELKARLKTCTHVVSYVEMAKELPPKRRQLVYLGKDQQSRPAAFARDLKKAAKQGKQALFEMKLLEASSRKRKWIADTVVESVIAKQKVTVLTGRRRDCEALAEAIEKGIERAKLVVPVYTGHGGDSMAYRDSLVQEYSTNNDACVLVGTTDAFGEAIDGLQHTDLVIFGLLPWTPGQVTQAEGRFSRHGGSRPVLILYTIAEGTVDEHVADMLLSKLEAVEQTLNDEEAGGIARTLAGEQDEEMIIQMLINSIEQEA